MITFIAVGSAISGDSVSNDKVILTLKGAYKCYINGIKNTHDTPVLGVGAELRASAVNTRAGGGVVGENE